MWRRLNMRLLLRLAAGAGLLLALALALFFASSLWAASPPQEEGASTPVIIMLKEPVRAEHAQAIEELGGVIKYRYTIINGIAASIPEVAQERIAQLPFVEAVEPDVQVRALPQTLPWGVDRIDAELVHLYNKGTGVKTAIVDSGIDYTHPDLAANYKGGYDFVNADTDPMDDNGHGTWTAGIAAAEDNDIGVIGVAPEAWLYALKVLDAGGSGPISDIVAAIQWAVKGPDGVAGNEDDADIINMSLGYDGPFLLTSLRDACDNAYAAGLLLVAAAGNHPPGTSKVEQPAKYDSVIAVGATNPDDSVGSYSDYGPEVELAAPGTSIPSTWWDGEDYHTGSGTSASSPHVAGVAALVWHGEPSLSNIQVRERLQQTAIDLGDPGRDEYFGYGLVCALEAAPPPAGFVSISVSDGAVAFGTVALGATIDTTASGINDAQTVTVEIGPANLDVKTSLFMAGGHSWSLGTTNGSDQVVWEFSPDGMTWTVFQVAGDLYSLASSVAQGATKELYLRLTMPTSTTSSEEYAATVTIVATAPP